jgi:hypothetical protein
MMNGKRGGLQWDVIMVLILGLIVLGISLYFLFHEYFTQEDIAWETCRQSVVLRGALPEAQKMDVNWVTFKDDFPLKCRTEVVEITKKTSKKVMPQRLLQIRWFSAGIFLATGIIKYFLLPGMALNPFALPVPGYIWLTMQRRSFSISAIARGLARPIVRLIFLMH